MPAVAQAKASSLTRELIDHAVSSIEAADRFSLPFPHIFFRDFFPKDFYAEMLRSIPNEGFDRLNKEGTRKAVRLYGENIGKVEAGVRDLWSSISAMLISGEVEDAIRRQLHEGLEIRAKGDKVASAEALRLVAQPVLYRDTDGYQIKPHPDGSKKVVTMQLYCPSDESQRDLGTTLYKASLKGLVNVGSYGLEPFKTLPFLPNVGYAFVVLKAYHSLFKMSWHGRPKVHTTSDHPRITLLNTFYVKEGVGF